MSYLAAASTKMLATHCVCCGRALRDAASVERGVGPDCAAKYGYGDAAASPDFDAALAALAGDVPEERLTSNFFAAVDAEDAHRAANILVHLVSYSLDSLAALEAIVSAIHSLGYAALAARIRERTLPEQEALVTIERTDDGRVIVRAPYSPNFVKACRAIYGRRYLGDGANAFPAAEARAVLAALGEAFDGAVAVGPKGRFFLRAA